MKPLVICQPLSKIDTFIFVVSHTMCSIFFFSVNRWGTRVLDFRLGNTNGRGRNFQKGDQTRVKLWYKCKEVLINKVFDSTHKLNIKKTMETNTPIADTKKLCVSKYSIERSKGQLKKSSKSRKSGLTNSGSLVKL